MLPMIFMSKSQALTKSGLITAIILLTLFSLLFIFFTYIIVVVNRK